jgi:hypothetical protein
MWMAGGGVKALAKLPSSADVGQAARGMARPKAKRHGTSGPPSRPRAGWAGPWTAGTSEHERQSSAAWQWPAWSGARRARARADMVGAAAEAC